MRPMGIQDSVGKLKLDPANIGRPTKCPHCSRAGVVDDIDQRSGVIIRHDATTWCVVPVAEACALTWDAFFKPPFDTTRLRKAIAERLKRKEPGRER
jgi:hypothetical protein